MAVFRSSDYLDRLPIRLGMTSPTAPALPTAALTLTAPATGSQNVAASALVSNTGTEPRAWSLAATPAGLTIAPSSGTIQAGQSTAVSLLSAAARTYTLTLTDATGAAVSGSPREFAVAAVAVAPVAEFIGSPTNGVVPFTVTFANQSTGTYSGVVWDFGDGLTSASPNPTHNYTTAGSYTVTLTLTWSGGTVTRTRTAYVQASSGVPTPSGFTILRTGTNYATIAAAITAAADGDVIEGAPGTYVAAAILVNKNLTIRSAVPFQQVIFDGTTVTTSGGGYMLRNNGFNVTLQDIRLTGNKFQNNYNAGITSVGLPSVTTLIRVEIDECSNGILQADNDVWHVWTLTDCYIHDCGDDTGLTHNLYFGKAASVTMRGCLSTMTKAPGDYTTGQEWRSGAGHLFKSRSKVLVLEGNCFDMRKGRASRCVDYPNSGDCLIQGNVFGFNTTQSGGIGQAIGIGLEGANRISGTTFDDRTHRIRIRQNTIFANSPNASSASNRDSMWIGVGCIAPGDWSNTAPTPAPTEYDVRDNVFCGWDDNPPRVIEGPGATTSTTYAINGSTNTCGALALLSSVSTFDYSLVDPVLGSQNWATVQYRAPTGTVVRADAYRGAIYSGWGTEATTGTYSSFVLTPGRDAAGVVNAASWALAPVGEWFEVAGTKIDTMVSNFPSAFTGFTDRGTEGWAAVVNSWNGMATDTRANNERLFLAACGGHAASSNNGVYKFDVRRMAWQVVRSPTPAASYPVGYGASGSYTYCEASAAAYALNPTGGGYYDQLPNGEPTSRHTYETQVFVPDVGAQGSILFACRRMWWLNIATGTWVKRGMAGAADPAAEDMGENGQGYWDENTRRYVHSGSQSNVDHNFWYHPESDTFGSAGQTYAANSYTVYFSSSEKIGRTLWTLLYDFSANRHGLPWRMVEWSLDNPNTGVNHNITLGSTFAAKTSSLDGWSDSGLTYVAPLNKWLITVSTAQDGECFAWIDPTTWVCELATIPGINAGQTGTAGGFWRTLNRFKYFASIGAVVWIPAGRSDLSNAVKCVRFLKVV